MEQEKYYSINVRGKEAKVQEVGYLDKKTGVPTGPTSKVRYVIGAITIPNYSVVWGELVQKDGKPTGEIKFMKWGAEGGLPIEIRFLPNCASLSKLYQDTVLKIVPRPEDGEIALKMGINNFDRVIDKLLIEMLEHHTLNGDNESRDPNKRDIFFYRHNAAKRLAKKTEAAEIRKKAVDIVFEVKDEYKRMIVLADVFNIDKKLPDDEIITDLLTRAEEEPRAFLQVMSDTVSNAKQLLKKALGYKLIDLRPENEVHLSSDGNKIQLFKDVQGKGEDKINWIAEHQFSAEVYDPLIKLAQEVAAYERNMHG